MLRRLGLEGVGPADRLDVQLGDRLNMITGDNGLGKSFLLDVAWWAMTRSWAETPALPNRGFEQAARISYCVDGRAGPVEDDIEFDPRRRGWIHGPGRPLVPGFVVYARVDGSFAVMDPARNDPPEDLEDGAQQFRRRPTAFYFDSRQVWSGLSEGDVQLCNGLIDDWRVWQLEESKEFEALTTSLALLSPDGDERLSPGRPRRIDLLDSREIPTLRMPYGEVPVTHASAAIRRILALAYLLVWGWHEHRAAAELLGEPPSENMTLLVDEVEAHLHPRWQRVILPAVLDVLDALGAPVHTQVLCVTHSPLVLASLEGRWNEQHDRLFVFDLVSANGEPPQAELKQLAWTIRGDVNRWLTSEIFDLGQARSLEAEQVIEQAQRIMMTPGERPSALGGLAQELAQHVPETDPLLARLDALISKERDGDLDPADDERHDQASAGDV